MKRQNAVVEINHVRLVIVPKLFRAQEELGTIGRVRRAASFGRVPFPIQLLTWSVVLRVKLLRIVAAPPQALPFGFGKLAILRNTAQRAGFVRFLSVLLP